MPALFPASGERIGHVRYGEPYPLGARAFFNPGSVGQPRDGDARAAYALVDLAGGTLTFHRSSYAIEKTQLAMRERSLPQILADRLAFGL